MKATINLEFTDDELKKHAADVGRRWVVTVFQEAFKIGQRWKIPPGFLEGIARAATDMKPQTGPVPAPEQGPKIDAELPNACVRFEQTGLSDEGWACCHCGAHNAVHRPACRLCEHVCCDNRKPPPKKSPRKSSRKSPRKTPPSSPIQ